MPASDWSKISPEEIKRMYQLQSQWEKGLSSNTNPQKHILPFTTKLIKITPISQTPPPIDIFPLSSIAA